MAAYQANFHDTWRARLSQSSRTDPLTDSLNRRGLAEAASAAFAQLHRYQRPVTLLVIDLDVFKSYNDIHGHQAGDTLLSWVASELRGAVRPSDTVARIGGDEFTVLCPTPARRARSRSSIGSAAPWRPGSATASVVPSRRQTAQASRSSIARLTPSSTSRSCCSG